MSEQVTAKEVMCGYSRVVLPRGEVVYMCGFCPCVFSSVHDVELHLSKGSHIGRVKGRSRGFKYGYIGLCYKSKSGRPVSVKNTVSNVLLCRGCRYFVEKVKA